jgi:hypothetical protein
MIATSAYAQQIAKKTNMMRFCRTPTGTASPQRTLIESTKLQITTHSGSTDPKNSGASVSATMVSQSWIDLAVSDRDFN